MSASFCKVPLFKTNQTKTTIFRRPTRNRTIYKHLKQKSKNHQLETNKAPKIQSHRSLLSRPRLAFQRSRALAQAESSALRACASLGSPWQSNRCDRWNPMPPRLCFFFFFVFGGKTPFSVVLKGNQKRRHFGARPETPKKITHTHTERHTDTETHQETSHAPGRLRP